MNLVNVVAGTHSRFLNSQNASHIASVVKVYAVPGWFDNLAVLGAALVEGLGAWLFIRALRRFRGDGSGLTEAYQALAWNIAVWFAFIVGTEFFVAYPSESPFRELLGLGFLMALLITLVPDAPGARGPASPRLAKDDPTGLEPSVASGAPPPRSSRIVLRKESAGPRRLGRDRCDAPKRLTTDRVSCFHRRGDPTLAP